MKRVSLNIGKALRSATSESVEYLGLKMPKNNSIQDQFAHHRKFLPVGDHIPYVAYDSFVAPNAMVSGRVGLLESSSVWYGAVIRGDDKNMIRVGFCSNIQDNAVLSTVTELKSGFPPDVLIGKMCNINQGALLTSCCIGDMCTIGQGAVVAEGAVVEHGSIIADGAVVMPYTLVPSKQLWAGNPAKYIRDVDDDEVSMCSKTAEATYQFTLDHKEEFFDEEYGTAWEQLEK